MGPADGARREAPGEGRDRGGRAGRVWRADGPVAHGLGGEARRRRRAAGGGHWGVGAEQPAPAGGRGPRCGQEEVGGDCCCFFCFFASGCRGVARRHVGGERDPC